MPPDRGKWQAPPVAAPDTHRLSFAEQEIRRVLMPRALWSVSSALCQRLNSMPRFAGVMRVGAIGLLMTACGDRSFQGLPPATSDTAGSHDDGADNGGASTPVTDTSHDPSASTSDIPDDDQTNDSSAGDDGSTSTGADDPSSCEHAVGELLWEWTGARSSPRSIALDGSNVYAAGEGRTPANEAQAWVAAFSSDTGHVAWEFLDTSGTSGETGDVATAVAVFPNTGVLAVGHTTVPHDEREDSARDAIWTARFSADGHLAWRRVEPPVSRYGDRGIDAVSADDGGVVMLATLEGPAQIMLRKFLADDTLPWEHVHSTLPSGLDALNGLWGHALAHAPDGSLYMLGAHAENPSGNEYVTALVRYGATGEAEHSFVLDPDPVSEPGRVFFADLVVTGSGEIEIIGRIEETYGALTPDAWLGRYGSHGTLQQTRVWGEPGLEEATSSLAVDAANNLVATGTTRGGAFDRGWVRKMDVDGQLIWEQEMPLASSGPQGSRATDVVTSPVDCSVYVVGERMTVDPTTGTTTMVGFVHKYSS